LPLHVTVRLLQLVACQWTVHRLATAFPPFIPLHHFLQSVHPPDICFGFCPYHAIYSFSVQCIFRRGLLAGARQAGMQPIHEGGEILDYLRVSIPEFVERPGLLNTSRIASIDHAGQGQRDYGDR
jgi:hypothetical protein